MYQYNTGWTAQKPYYRGDDVMGYYPVGMCADANYSVGIDFPTWVRQIKEANNQAHFFFWSCDALVIGTIEGQRRVAVEVSAGGWVSTHPWIAP